MLSSFDLIEQIHDQKGFVKLGLIDPDKKNDKKLLKIIQNIESSNFDGMPTKIYSDGNNKTFFPHMESFQNKLGEYLI